MGTPAIGGRRVVMPTPLPRRYRTRRPRLPVLPGPVMLPKRPAAVTPLAFHPPAPKRRMARCHADQPNVRRGMCAGCLDAFQRGDRPNGTGLRGLGDSLGSMLPLLKQIPETCLRCENPVLTHYEGSPEVNCIRCGWEGLLEPPVGPNGPLWR